MTDTELLDKLERILWSQQIGNGIAIVPTVTNKNHKCISLVDLGDEDGSGLGNELVISMRGLRPALEAIKESA